MNPRVLVGGMALLCGIGAFYLATNYMKKGNQGPKMVPVLWSTKLVPIREKITEPGKYFALKDVAEGSFPPKALRSFDDIKDQRLKKNLTEDNYVTKDDLADPKQYNLADTVAPGMRLFAISVTAESLGGGFVLPGSNVDVIGTKRVGNGNVESLTILQNVKVLAVGDQSTIIEDKTSVIGNTVSLELTPEQVTILSNWKTQGEIKLSARRIGDNVLVETNPVKLNPDPIKEPEKPIVKDPNPMPKAVVKEGIRHQLLILETRESKGGDGASAESVVFVQDEKGRWRTQLLKSVQEPVGFGNEKKAPMPEEPPPPMDIRKNKVGS